MDFLVPAVIACTEGTVLEECKSRYKLIFDPKIKISQDVELAWRLRSHGFKLVYVINNVRHLKKLNPSTIY